MAARQTDVIESIASKLRYLKGSGGQLELNARYKDFFCNSTEWNEVRSRASGIESAQGTMRVGEILQIRGVAPFGGYVHVFNFDTKGQAMKIFPASNDRMHVGAGLSFIVPDGGEQSTVWRIRPPLSADSRLLEQILCLITQEDSNLTLACLDPALGDVTTAQYARGGFSAPVTSPIPRFFLRSPESFDFGWVRLDIRGQE